MFKKLGLPQLFLTFTCNDFAEECNELLPGERPWADPVLFAQYWKRSMQQLLNRYILKSVSFKIQKQHQA
jgi:hypothetical protein